MQAEAGLRVALWWRISPHAAGSAALALLGEPGEPDALVFPSPTKGRASRSDSMPPVSTAAVLVDADEPV
jgi:hypothetical protein